MTVRSRLRRVVGFLGGLSTMFVFEAGASRGMTREMRPWQAPADVLTSSALRGDAAALRDTLDASLQKGQYRAAEQILEQMRVAAEAPAAARDRAGARDQYAAAFARFALETEQWSLAMETPDSAAAQTVAWYARGIGAARSAGRGERPHLREIARDAAARLEEIASREGRGSTAEIARLGVLASIAASEDERDEMHVLLAHATSLEDARMRAASSPELFAVPLHELAGDLWLLVDRYSDARAEYAAALQRPPRRPRTLYRFAVACQKSGDAAAARAAFAEFLELWKDADTDRPELDAARKYLAGAAGIRD